MNPRQIMLKGLACNVKNECQRGKLLNAYLAVRIERKRRQFETFDEILRKKYGLDDAEA